jgi:hypothetical protein
VWPATALTFGLLDSARARQTLEKLARDSISADWGAHILSTGSPLYDPMHYNNGAIWPFVTGFVIWGQYTYARPWAAYPLLDALAQMTFDFARGRHPELLSGSYYRPLDTAVPQQFFATSMLVSPLMYGLLGWEPDAPRNRARLAPQLPPDWTLLRARRLRVGPASVDVVISRLGQALAVRLTADRGAPTIGLEVPLPPGARLVDVTLDSVPVTPERDAGARSRVRLDVPTGAGPRVVVVRWEGGLDLVPPTTRLTPGQESRGIRVLDFGARDGGWDLVVEGERGRTYDLRLLGPAPRSATGATLEPRADFSTTLRVTFPEGTGRTTARVRIER